MKAFADISRHPESIVPGDTACLVCEDGPASWCGSCWAVAVAEQRTVLREQSGRDIGRWPDYPERLRWEEELLRQQRVARDGGEDDR